MLKRCVRKLGSQAPLGSAMPFIPSDIGFHYPRFQLATHVSDNLPELKEAKRLIAEAPTPGANDKKITVQLRRAEEIFRNVAPDGKINGANTPAYLLKDWLGVAAAYVRHDGLARTPKQDRERLAVLAPLVRTVKTAPLKDLAIYDSLCVIVAAYADSAIRIATYGDQGIGSLMAQSGKIANLEFFRSPSESVVTFGQLCEATDLLLDAAYDIAIAQKDSDQIRSIRNSYSRLCALRAVLEIPTTGALHTCLEIIDRPSRLRGQDEELICLLVAMRAEVRARLENGAWGLECIDELVSHDFQQSNERLYFNFPKGKPDNGIELEGLETLRDAYCSAILARAAYYLAIPKDPKGEAPGVYTFHAGRQLILSPISLCPRGGPLVSDCSSRIHMKSQKAKNLARKEAERALKINRALYKHDRNNLKAGYILRFLAITYAELKDYLYANGLFNSAVNIFTQHYGADSLEVAETMRWHEAYHRFVGSTQEADAQLNRINRIRAEHGLDPTDTLAAVGVQKPGGPKIQSVAMDTGTSA